ncbi:MAG: hypothetical protein ACKVI3_11730 [Verrucomicrobiia bacterium]|tara:strand:- start:103 stop:273 length:171 start_codon:yes stop_codon:yes gene_type:complete
MKPVFKDDGYSLLNYQNRIYMEGPRGAGIVEGEIIGRFLTKLGLKASRGSTAKFGH